MRPRRGASARGDVPDAPPTQISTPSPKSSCAPSRTVFRDPVFVLESGHTYERSAILSHFRRNGAKDPLTRRALSSTKVMTNWAMRKRGSGLAGKHPGVTPDGWDSRELLEPSEDDGTRTFDDEGDVEVLRTWRAMCPELQETWTEDERPEALGRVTMENGRVVQLELEDFGLTVPAEMPRGVDRVSSRRWRSCGSTAMNELTIVPAQIGQLTSLTELNLGSNQLTSVPAEIGQLTSLRKLFLYGNQLTIGPAEIGQLARR